MASKSPTKKQMVEKIEAINSVNNMVARTVDQLGYAFSQYLLMKGETENLKNYLEDKAKNSKLSSDEKKKDNNETK